MQNKLVRQLILLLLVVVLISVGVIYFTFDIRALEYLTMFKPWSILGALGVLALGLFFDGTRLMQLTRVAGEELSIREAVNVVLSNYFLALVTPGASGGAIAQIMFMKRAGIPVAKATAVVLVRTLMSIMFLIFLVPLVLHSDHNLVKWMPTSVITLVSLVFISLPIVAIFLMRTRYPEYWLVSLTAKCSRPLQRNCFGWYKEFKKASFLMGKNPVSVFRAFVESGVSLLALYSVVPVFFKGFGLEVPYFLTMGRMVLLNLVLYFSPTPGGSGIAEGGFVVLFTPLLPSGIVGVMAVLWRLFCEYIPFLLGGVVTVRAFGANVLSKITLRKKDVV
ncbi:MAG: lysylphosphatidylglycerol synthase transmembrane domain-containing protein [Acidaminococcaceae bacterium]